MAASDKIDLSIIVPCFNESENVVTTVEKIAAALSSRSENWELIIVNDGSTDDTLDVVKRIAADDPRIIPAGYPVNGGRGKALRTGFKVARGDIICSTDADLSYKADYICDLLAALDADPDIDFVLGSPYMPGGSTNNVPKNRLFISRLGNRVLQFTVNRDIYTFTCVFRAYRREVIDAIVLESDGKEIHLEILSRALGAGFRVKEVPAVLTARQKGKSKFRFGGTAVSHLLFSLTERPSLFFGIGGILLLVLGLITGSYITFLRFAGDLNADRPLMTLVVILVLGGLQVLSFGLIAHQIGVLRTECFKTQREARLLRRQVDLLSPTASDKA
jgi:glycosyltransferase involved in cell wall biosynthesis